MNIIPSLLPGDLLRTGTPVDPFPWGGEVFYYASGRAALLAGAKLLLRERRARDTLLVPDFICEEALFPLRDAGFKIEYYSIDRQYGFSLADVGAGVGKRTLAVIAVHYFGVPAKLGDLKRLCRDKGACLIEDCAHSFGGRETGMMGDLSFFSIRKFVPVPDGGALVVNNKELLSGGRRPEISPARGGRAGFLTSVARSVKGLLRSRFPVNYSGAAGSVADICPRADLVRERAGFSAGEAISSGSRSILDRQDLTVMAARRRNNYQKIAAAVVRLAGAVVPFPTPGEGWSPYVLPLQVDEDRQLAALTSLVSRGIMASDWPTLPGDLPESSGARRLSRRTIILPVHQHLRQDAANRIGDVLGEVLS
jgi:dTDP-4-amino-4,6-dideoxygalactose transaminase